MIFEIGTPIVPTPDFVYLVPCSPWAHDDAINLYDMIDAAFPNAEMTLCCFGGYENAVCLRKN